MSVPGIESVQMAGFTPYVAPTLTNGTDPLGTAAGAGVGAASGTAGASATTAPGHAFGSMVLDGIDRLEAVQDRSGQLAVQAATGNLDNIHDYTIAATEASVTAQLTVAVRNRALESFNEIMRMGVG